MMATLPPPLWPTCANLSVLGPMDLKQPGSVDQRRDTVYLGGQHLHMISYRDVPCR